MERRKDRRIRQITKRIMEVLEKIPSDVDIEVGMKIDIIPKPVIQLYVNLLKLRKHLHKTTSDLKQERP